MNTLAPYVRTKIRNKIVLEIEHTNYSVPNTWFYSVKSSEKYLKKYVVLLLGDQKISFYPLIILNIWLVSLKLLNILSVSQ